MATQNYYSAIKFTAERSPTLDKPTPFIKWAEEFSDILSFIYDRDYDTVTEDLVTACKEVQDWEGSEE